MKLGELWQQHLPLPPGALITLIGGGGKTSLMFYLQRLLTAAGRPAAAGVTTRLAAVMPPDQAAKTVQQLRDAIAAVRAMLPPPYLTLTGGFAADDAKWLGADPQLFTELAAAVPEAVLLIEGDGAAGRPVKGYLPHEPVIPLGSTAIITVVGSDGIGQPIGAGLVHREERVQAVLQAGKDTILTPRRLAQLFVHPEGYLGKCPGYSPVIPFINKAEGHLYPPALALGKAILALAPERVPGVMVGSLRKEEGIWLAR